MIIMQLGQTPRDSVIRRSDGITAPPPDGTLPEETLDTSKIIANRIASHYEGPYEHSRVEAIKLADRDIRPDQRFYDVEYRQASLILAARSPTTETAHNWYTLMKNYAGWRIVPIPFCKYGEVSDPVSRKCVTERAYTPPVDRIAPRPEETIIAPIPEDKDNGTQISSLIVPLGIVGVLAIVMLGGRK